MDKDFKELQEYIGSIAITAKLLGYTVFGSSYKAIIFKPDLSGSVGFYVEVSVFDNGSNTIETRFVENPPTKLSKECHEEKIHHLQKILEGL